MLFKKKDTVKQLLSGISIQLPKAFSVLTANLTQTFKVRNSFSY